MILLAKEIVEEKKVKIAIKVKKNKINIYKVIFLKKKYICVIINIK